MSGDQDRAAAGVGDAADRSQAEHFIHVLSENCAEIDRRIAKYQTAMMRYESRRQHNEVQRCRRMIRGEESDRGRLEWMIAALHKRFSVDRRERVSSAR